MYVCVYEFGCEVGNDFGDAFAHVCVYVFGYVFVHVFEYVCVQVFMYVFENALGHEFGY